MYISYGFSVGIVLAVGVLLYYLAHDLPIWVYLTTVATIVFLFTPLLFRYARILLLHYFSGVKFDPSYPRH
jgi:Na+/citrate or Na+/malate symporter